MLLRCCLKLVSAIFNQICIFHQMIELQKSYEKCFLFHLRSSFCSRDIQIFVFPSSPLFLPIRHCFRGCSKIILVYDVINCLNKILMMHFNWYLEKKKRYDIETFSIGKVLNKAIFMEKSYRKCAPEANPKHLFNFGK